MRATVIGMGYVGLVTAACLAEWGHDVVGVDCDDRRLEDLKAGRMPIHEPGLEELVASGAKAKRLRFAAPSARTVVGSQLVFVAVGTHDGDGGWQTSTIQSALASVVPEMADDSTVVVRSTLPNMAGEILPQSKPQASKSMSRILLSKAAGGKGSSNSLPLT